MFSWYKKKFLSYCSQLGLQEIWTEKDEENIYGFFEGSFKADIIFDLDEKGNILALKLSKKVNLVTNRLEFISRIDSNNSTSTFL